jgi:glycosyltransferase involved in cell wall biosynthesis
VVRFYRDLAKLEAQIGKTREQAASIVFMFNQILADAQMPRLYAAATHYLSLSYGEGWDLPMMEAAAMGLQLIAPQHSAYTTYLDDSIAMMLPARQAPARFESDEDMQALFRGADWWEPDEQAAADCLRRVISSGKAEFNWAARARMMEHFTWERATDRLIGVLQEVEEKERRKAAPRKAWFRSHWPSH